MHGFKRHDAASRFRREYSEVRAPLRPRRCYNQIVSDCLRRSRFVGDARVTFGIIRTV